MRHLSLQALVARMACSKSKNLAVPYAKFLLFHVYCLIHLISRKTKPIQNMNGRSTKIVVYTGMIGVKLGECRMDEDVDLDPHVGTLD